MSELSPPVTELELCEFDGPKRVGSELRWGARLPDGRRAVVAMLAPELASDESVRRRWVRDVQRVAELGLPALCPPLELGPLPDPRDPSAAPPWRVRLEPTSCGGAPLETLEAWIRRRAPAPFDEVAHRVEAIAKVVREVHGAGEVLRDLDPRTILVEADGSAAWLADAGLARVDILSTRTAASLILEGSAYASPEQLRRTVIDQRSDIYGLGVILFHAITGTLPHGDEPLLLRGSAVIASLRALRVDCPPAIDELVRRCLAEDPGERPESVDEVLAVLRGEAASCAALATAPCQSCGARMRPGQRLCIACGREAVQFHFAAPGASETWAVDLTKATEDRDFTRRLTGVLAPVASAPLRAFNFIIGDKRMYSKEERQRRLALPLRLFSGMTAESASSLVERMGAAGLTAKAVKERSPGRREAASLRVAAVSAVGIVAALTVLAGAAFGSGIALMLCLILLIAAGVGLAVWRARGHRQVVRASLLQLRPSPAALPASDPWVGRLASLLDRQVAADVRDCVGEVALQVQRLVDHRARNLGEAGTIDAVTVPVGELVGHVRAEVARIIEIDRGLASLDEGRLVRALAAGDARGEPASSRTATLAGLDRLRELEQARARAFHKLLEAARLMRRSIDLGLEVHDGQVVHDLEVAKALAVLTDSRGS